MSSNAEYLGLSLPPDILQAAVEHIALPPKLPQEAPDGSRGADIESAICALAVASAHSYASELPEEERPFWTRIEKTLDALQGFVASSLDKRDVLAELQGMVEYDTLAFHIRAQNAAVIIRRNKDYTIFEAFEVQPPTEVVMRCSGKLVRVFPEAAVQVANTIVDELGFLDQIATLFASMYVHKFDDAAAKTRKAGVDQEEVRNATNPKYICELFMSIMRGYGEVATTRMTKKRTADEVLWKDAFAPWRRSPVWLLIRVILQSSVPEPLQYKMFMVYLHATCLRYSALQDLDGDLLYAMRAKMARRLHKLSDHDLPGFLIRKALDSVTQTETLLQRRWDDVQEEDRLFAQSKWAPESLDLDADIIQSLPNCADYLRQVIRQEHPSKPISDFEPTSPVRLRTSDFGMYANGGLERAVASTSHLALFDFELTVETHLESWLGQRLKETNGHLETCETLVSCALQYHDAAKQIYSVDAVDRSIYALTIVHLWTALDQVVTKDVPMLLDYSPQIPSDFLHPLLLRSRESIARSISIEQYVLGRHSSTKRHQSLFSDDDATTFAVRFFDSSPPLQNLMREIKQSAERERRQKIDELARKNAEYQRLDREFRSRSHEQIRSEWNRRWYCSDCRKCAFENERRQVASRGIEVHEWPLPSDETQAKRVVFELAPPKALQLWRSLTRMVVSDVGLPPLDTTEEHQQLLRSYQPLAQHADAHRFDRVTMASRTKSFIRAHYHCHDIPTTDAEVCRPNGLRFAMYDDKASRWAAGPFHGSGLSSCGTLHLPKENAYRYLQFAVDSTTHSTNKVVADRFDCPKQLSLQEHDAFGSLRSGGMLQWLNILRELNDCALTMRREEVNTLLTQAAWQIGPLSDCSSCRVWHEELQTSQFGRQLLETCHRVLENIKENWLESVTLRTLIALVLRLLASLPSQGYRVREAALAFLQSARTVAFKWLMDIIKAGTPLNEKSVLVCEMAMLTRMTYDVGHNDTLYVLQQAEDIFMFIRCAIALQADQPPLLAQAKPYLQVMICRDRRLAHKLQSVLIRSPTLWSGFDMAVHAAWDSYSAGLKCEVVLDGCWMCGESNSDDGSSQRVDYNVMDGTLLVDGKPIGRLPHAYTVHPTYIRTFGSAVLDVIPGPKDMEYATVSKVSGNHIFAFTLQDGLLRIQATSANGRFELIPHENLRLDFPSSLVEEHMHWMNLATQVMEFRPRQDPWTSNPENWCLRMKSGQPSIRRLHRRAEEHLVDYHSPTFGMLSKRVSRLEEACDLIIIRTTNLLVYAILPRLRLQFSINGTKLACDTFPNTAVDDDQSCGTLIGLRNRLVLRSTLNTGANMRLSRSVLIPHGTFNVERQGHHVHVNTDTSDRASVTYSRFDVDDELGRLSGESNLTDRLLKIYLHAVTTSPLPDPLLQRMGVEQALQELSSGAVHSFLRLDESQFRMLDLIDSITPRRAFYPPNMRCMETVEWSPLSVFAQHAAFAPLVHGIMQHAQTMSMFDTSTIWELPSSRQDYLLQRAAGRVAQFYPASMSLGRQGNTPNFTVVDETYGGRVRGETTEVDVNAAAQAVQLVWLQYTGVNSMLQQDLLQAFSSNRVQPPAHALRLGYHPDWSQLQLRTHWLAMYDLARHSHRKGTAGRHALAFSLCTMSYTSTFLRIWVPILAAVASNHRIRTTDPPEWTSYDFSHGFEPRKSQVEALIVQHSLPMQDTPAYNLVQRSDESGQEHLNRQQSAHYNAVQSKAREWAQHLMGQRGTLYSSGFDYNKWLDEDDCLASVTEYFDHCAHNAELRQHLGTVGSTLRDGSNAMTEVFIDQTKSRSFELVDASTRTGAFERPRTVYRKISGIFPRAARTDPPGLIHYHLQLEHFLQLARVDERVSSSHSDLLRLIDELQLDNDSIRRLYGDDLSRSLLALQQGPSVTPHVQIAHQATPGDLSQTLQHASMHYRKLWQTQLQRIQELHIASVEPDLQVILALSGLMARHALSDCMKTMSARSDPQGDPEPHPIVCLSRLFILYQQLERMRKLAAGNRFGDLAKEYANWRPVSYESSDDILLQIDGDFRIRTHQSAIAQEMIAPSSGQSTTKQLNMGEGKSSVIVPMTVCALADGVKLVRIIALKSLSVQMFHLLVSRVGSLLNRRVYFFPFSRQVNLGGSNLGSIMSLLRQCAREGGILLAQPEHILSLKLLTQDQRLSSAEDPSSKDAANQLEEIDEYLRSNSRDVLDESDELLDVRYQLIYTMGEQQHLDNAPSRWTTTQQLLSIVGDRISDLPVSCREYHDRGDGAFPEIRILQTSETADALDTLKRKIAEAVLDGKLQNINLAHISSREDKELVIHFLTQREVFDWARVQLLCDGIWKGVLLLRGLLAFDVLSHVLTEKRHRVNYGLDLKRSLLAVPYSAKDVPTLRSEFSHPDVAVALTTLSYYYTGLDFEQMVLCFDELAKTDDPALEYSTWVRRNPSTHSTLRTLNGVNTKDSGRFRDHVLPEFRQNQATIDFYLARVVFPKQAKEFPSKMSTSGWDLAEQTTHVSTGFSGTNDRKHLLPTSIEQRDHPEQLGTNAMVLSYLLQDENRRYQCMHGSTASDFLQVIKEQTPTIRVLLDVGAQMLDMKNKELVEYWLEHARPEGVSAAVYCNEKDELTVLSDDGAIESFQSSPYRHSMEKVVVYLDDAHTRGTDLKLPKDTRAAVTLGPRVTKDRLVQGCMRLRQLGHGQSVMFFAPSDCDARIRDAARGTTHSPDDIDSLDVLRWVMQQTCHEIRHYVPHWVQQGLEYFRHASGRSEYFRTSNVDTLRNTCVTPEGRDLDKMYGPQRAPDDLIARARAHSAMAVRLDSLGITTLYSRHLDEEQEREVSHEMELESEPERPPRATPATPSVHPHVRAFIKDGIIVRGSSQFQSLMIPISIAGDDGATWSSTLYGTADFFKATNRSASANFSTYARPVRWIASAGSDEQTLVVLSPHEANELLPLIRKGASVHLHMYTPRVVQSMRSFSDLRFYAIPSLKPAPSVAVQCQLDLFAGQLYLDEWTSYIGLCAFLGISSPESQRLYGIDVIERRSDGFVLPEHRPVTDALLQVLKEFGVDRSFAVSPVEALAKHVNMRRNGMDFAKTHLGRILNGRYLEEEDFVDQQQEES